MNARDTRGDVCMLAIFAALLFGQPMGAGQEVTTIKPSSGRLIRGGYELIYDCGRSDLAILEPREMPVDTRGIFDNKPKPQPPQAAMDAWENVFMPNAPSLPVNVNNTWNRKAVVS